MNSCNGLFWTLLLYRAEADIHRLQTGARRIPRSVYPIERLVDQAHAGTTALMQAY